jgi:hypothetical protein
MDLAISGKGSPRQTPAKRLTNKKAIKELTFQYVINSTKRPRLAITMNKVIE